MRRPGANRGPRFPPKRLFVPHLNGSCTIDDEGFTSGKTASEHTAERNDKSVEHRLSARMDALSRNLLVSRGKQLETSGEAGIRTLGTLLGYNALAKRRFRPLSHLTKNESAEYYDRGWTSN
jgi:hypothetical protein